MKAGYKVKLCGTTTRADAELAAREGADSFGVVVEVEFSPRSLRIEEARELFHEPPLPAVALVFGMAEERIDLLLRELQPHAIQFLSQEEPALLGRLKQRHSGVQLWQSIHLPAAGERVELDSVRQAVDAYIEIGVDALLFDTVAMVQGKKKYGGTGVTSDWSAVRDLMDHVGSRVTVYLAGGIHPGNVAEALEALHPDGVDLCSGVEAAPGVRDAQRVRALMTAVAGAGLKEEIA